MCIELFVLGSSTDASTEKMSFHSPEGKETSHLMVTTLNSRYCGKLLNTVTISDVSTEPEYRRAGAVRKMIENVFSMAPERGWTVSFLHPFSFSYYRKFGYEKVANHLILEFPMHKLEHVERCANFVLVDTQERVDECIEVYGKFAVNRNIMFHRCDAGWYPIKNIGKRRTYLWHDAKGEPGAYITLEVENQFYVNHMQSIHLSVYEMVFTTPESLRALFGFMKMYEGQNESVKIHNCAMSPEVDMFLRHYTHVKYTVVPDISARILDVPTILAAHSYPNEHGYFTVRVEDTLPWTRGVYGVEFQNGEAQVTRLAEDHAWDISAEMPAFTQLMYGFDEYSADVVPFMEGVVLQNPKSDFFRVFHKMNNGVFEHF